jgi:hypothetical protein
MAALVTASSASAQSIYRPLGLQPGDEYRLLFVTDGKRNALSTDIADYNAFVTWEANQPNSLVRGLTVEWFAIASTIHVDAIENTGTDPSPPGDTGVPIYLVDGASRVANHYDNLWNPSSIGDSYLLSAPNLTQYGVGPADAINNVWTGTDYHGVAGGIGGAIGADSTPSVGVSLSPNGRWINNNFSASASTAKSFYAVSSVLIAAPEPSAGMLFATAAAALLPRRRGTLANRKNRLQGTLRSCRRATSRWSPRRHPPATRAVWGFSIAAYILRESRRIVPACKTA